MKKLATLKAKDFTQWVKKQIRSGIEEICEQRYSAVEIWLKELGYNVGFISGGIVELYDTGDVLNSGWGSISYYMFHENGMMVTSAQEWLEIAKSEDQDHLLIARM